MVIAIRKPDGFIAILKRHICKKKDNIYCEEERVIERDFSLSRALAYISEELRTELKGATLHIIDAYFSPHESVGSFDECTEELLDWTSHFGIRRIDLYTKTKGEFPSACVARFDGIIPFKVSKLSSDIHDRFWIVEKDGCCAGVMVGSSLSGVGKNFTVVCKISDNDMEQLRRILNECGIII